MPPIGEQALLLATKAWLIPLYFSRPLQQQTTFLFGSEGVVTLPNSNVSTNAAGTALDLKVLINSGFKGGNGITAAQLKKDPRGFEQWCRDQGLLIEINHADYAEPKLAVIS